MPKGRKPYPRWTVKPNDGSHNGILIGAETAEDAIEKARKLMKWDGLLTATETYNY